MATGIGSLPGTDPMAAARTVVTELPDFPHLAELPARGPGADMIGRTAGLLVDINVETTPRGWRLSSDRPGKDPRRARSMLSQDLDALEEVLDGYTGLLKVQVAGPWTLASALEQTHSLKAALADPGAVADLTTSLAEGTRRTSPRWPSGFPAPGSLSRWIAPGCPPRWRGRSRPRVACPASARSTRRSSAPGSVPSWPWPLGATPWFTAAGGRFRSG